jgi:hypothetical protein
MTATAAQDPILAQVFEAACSAPITVGRDSDDNVNSGLFQVAAANVTWWVSVKPGRPVIVRNASGWAGSYRGAVATADQADRIRNRMLWEFGGRW